MKRYKVGPGKPPLETRFQPGNQEWRKREAKRAAKKSSVLDDFRDAVGSMVRVKRNDRMTEDIRLQVIVDTLAQNAANGDVGAADALLTLHEDSKPFGEMRETVLLFDEPGDGDN